MTEGDGGRDLRSDGWVGLRSMMSLAAGGFSLLSLPFPSLVFSSFGGLALEFSPDAVHPSQLFSCWRPRVYL